MAQVPVTVKQVLAAKVRVAGDKALGRSTPAWVIKLAKTPIPASATQPEAQKVHQPPSRVSAGSSRR